MKLYKLYKLIYFYVTINNNELWLDGGYFK